MSRPATTSCSSPAAGSSRPRSTADRGNSSPPGPCRPTSPRSRRTTRARTSLVSVAGTPEAQEALIADSIPQTATVTRGPAEVDLLYDGAADGAPAVRAGRRRAGPAIRRERLAAGHRDRARFVYYACRTASGSSPRRAAGPWVVATAVPPAIYAIPPSCPLHYVTYCRIYGFTPSPCTSATRPAISAPSSRPTAWWFTGPVTVIGRTSAARGSPSRARTASTRGSRAGRNGIRVRVRRGTSSPADGRRRIGGLSIGDRGITSTTAASASITWTFTIIGTEDVVSIPQRPTRAGEEENARLHLQAPFNPYSARPTPFQLLRPSISRPRKRVSSIGARTPSRVRRHSAARATAAANRRAQVSRLNNVFVSATGEVYRRAPTPEPAANPESVEPG